MALSYGVKLRTFEGRVDESIEEWIEEFENIANFNNWANADEARNPRLRAAAAHLKEEALQLIPVQTSSTNTNRIYQDMNKEKKDDAMEELMKEFKEMKVHYMNQTRNNNRNYQGNYQRNYQGDYQENNNRRRNYDNLV